MEGRFLALPSAHATLLDDPTTGRPNKKVRG
ncbi:MAG: hypothetical protein ACI87O_000200, partial [Planctomycetota bacterium]